MTLPCGLNSALKRAAIVLVLLSGGFGCTTTNVTTGDVAIIVIPTIELVEHLADRLPRADQLQPLREKITE